MIKKQCGIVYLIAALSSLGLVACSSGGGGGGGSASYNCNTAANFNDPSYSQHCPNGATGYTGQPGAFGLTGASGTGTFIMGFPKDGSVPVMLNSNPFAVARWAMANELCEAPSGSGQLPRVLPYPNSQTQIGQQMGFDCLSISNAVLSFHIEQSDNSAYYGGYYGQQTVMGQARWRVRMTDQSRHFQISKVFDGQVVKVGNGFQIQSGSTVISIVGNAMGSMNVTLTYRDARGVNTLGTGTMRGM